MTEPICGKMPNLAKLKSKNPSENNISVSWSGWLEHSISSFLSLVKYSPRSDPQFFLREVANKQTDRQKRKKDRHQVKHNLFGGVTGKRYSSGVTRGRTAPGDTLQGGDTRRKKNLWTNLQRIVEKRGRTGKNVWGDTLEAGRGDSRVKAIKSDSDSDSNEQKRWSAFEKKKPGMTPQNWRLKRFFRKK